MYISTFRNGALLIQRHWNTTDTNSDAHKLQHFVGRLIEIVFFILIVVFILDLWWFTNHHRATYNLPGQVKFTCLECGRAREWVVADR